MNKCIICENENTKLYKAEFVDFLKDRMFDFKNYETELVHCPDCKIFYSSNRPSDELMNKFYDGYRNEAYQQQREKYESFYTKEFNYNLGFAKESITTRDKILSSLAQNYIDGKKITNLLDFGGDNGQYISKMFKDANRFVYDISGTETVDGVRKISNFEELKEHHWDFIMCCHVLEHLSYPMDTINKIISIMPIGGFLYIEVPYETYCDGTTKNNDLTYIHEHINFFRTETFEKIFNNANFIIIENHYTDIPQVDGQVFEKHIQCLVQKIEPSINSIIAKQNYKLNKNSNITKETITNLLNNTNLNIQNTAGNIQNITTETKNITYDIQNITGNIQNALINVQDTSTNIQNILISNFDNLNNSISLLNNRITQNEQKIDNLNCLLEAINKKLNKPNLLQKLFSVTNEKEHKVLRILGIKIKFKRGKKNSKSEVMKVAIPVITPNVTTNKIILVENGIEREIQQNELPQGISIIYTPDCHNNIVKIEIPQNFSNNTISFQSASNCEIEIKSSKWCIHSLFMLCANSNIKMHIDKDVSICSASFMSNQAGSSIKIGEDCMFASNVKIVAADGHTIYDKDSNEIINRQRNTCTIGNHVWLGDDTRIMKNAIIPDGTIVAANSIVTKAFDEKNIIIAGNPGKIVKHNILWQRDIISDIGETNK